LYVQTTLLFTTPAVMLERQGVIAAMSRSRALVAGSWWRVFGIFLLATIMAEIIASIIVIPFALFGIGSILSGHTASEFQFSHLLVAGIGGFIAATLVRPFTSGVIALLYLDRRMRAEALDLTLQNAAARTPS
jgi:membrane-anchored glycerophosphoryl diester phosphodiesterase (GDPDase)